MRQHLWREVRRQLREASGFGLVAALLLAVGGAWALVAWSFLQWGRQGLLRASDQAVVVAVLAETSDPARIQVRVSQRFPGYAMRLLSHQEVARELAGWTDVAPSGGLVPAALTVTVPPSALPEVVAALQGEPGVAAVVSSHQWVGPALHGFSLALRLAGFLAAVLVVAFAALVVLAVRVLVLSHADEIAIMRLIGAHEGDIQAPYVVASVILGLAGGIAAVGLGLVGRLLLARWVALPSFEPAVMAVAIAGGGLAGGIGAFLGVRSLPQEA